NNGFDGHRSSFVSGSAMRTKNLLGFRSLSFFNPHTNAGSRTVRTKAFSLRSRVWATVRCWLMGDCREGSPTAGEFNHIESLDRGCDFVLRSRLSNSTETILR